MGLGYPRVTQVCGSGQPTAFLMAQTYYMYFEQADIYNKCAEYAIGGKGGSQNGCRMRQRAWADLTES